METKNRRCVGKIRREIKVKFILGGGEFLEGDKATHLPHTKQVVIGYRIKKNGWGDVHHGEGKRERERRYSR